MIFGIDLAQKVADGFSGQLHPLTLSRVVVVDYDPVLDEDITETKTFKSEGIVSHYQKGMIAEGAVETNDRQIVILGQPLGTDPEPGDTIEIEEETFTVVGIDERDPASAVFIVQGRL